MVETRTFKEIWNAWSRFQKEQFYEKLEGIREATVRSYGTGRRIARGPSLYCLVKTFKKLGIDVLDGRYLFKEK